MTDEEPLVSREPTAPDGDAGHALVTRSPAESVAGAGADTPAAPSKGQIAARRVLMTIVITLVVVLAALLVWLFFLLTRPGGGLYVSGGAPRAGIEPVLTIVGPGRGASPYFKRPMGVAFGPGGRIYVADTGNNRVCVFDGNGAFLFEFGGFGVRKPLPGGTYTWAPGRMDYPIGIAVDPADGGVYVADFHNDQIQKFDAEGKYMASFPDASRPVGRGSSGQDGRGIAVTDVAVAGGLVYATDAYQIFVFGTDGRFVRQFGKPGRGPADLDHPNGVAAARDGTIYVSDSNHARVIAFDETGTRIWAFGETRAGSGDAPSSLGMPRGLAVMADGSLVVADAFRCDLAVLDATGATAVRYGERGLQPGQFNFPNEVDAAGDLLLVADKENDRVEVLKLARR